MTLVILVIVAGVVFVAGWVAGETTVTREYARRDRIRRELEAIHRSEGHR